MTNEDLKFRSTNRHLRKQRGNTILGTVIALPIILVAVAVIFDLTRLYLVVVMTQDVALTTAKLANSADPSVDIPEPSYLVKSFSGEDPTITVGRQQFWIDQVTSSSATYHGADYFSDKELQAFNLGYGYMAELNSKIAFPIPVLDPLTSSDLGGVSNCSIYFSFVDLVLPIDTAYNYSRIYTVECAVPMWGLQLFGNMIAPNGFIIVSRTAYSHQSGGLEPSA